MSFHKAKSAFKALIFILAIAGLWSCEKKESAADREKKSKANQKVLSNRLDEAPTDFLRLYKDAPIGWQNWGEEIFVEAKAQEKPVMLVVGSGRFIESFSVFNALHQSESLVTRLNEGFICAAADTHAFPELSQYSYGLAQIRESFSFPMVIWLSFDGHLMAWRSLASEDEGFIIQRFASMMSSISDTWSRDIKYANRHSADNSEKINTRLKPAVLEIKYEEVDQNEVSNKGMRQLLSLYDSIGKRIDGIGSLVPSRYIRALDQYHYSIPNESGLASEARMVIRDVIPTYLDSPLKDPTDKGFFYAKMGADWDLPNFCKALESQAEMVGLLARDPISETLPDSRSLMAGALAQINGEFTNPDGSVGAYRLARSLKRSKDFFLWKADDLEAVLSDSQYRAVKAISNISEIGNISALSDPLKIFYRLNTIGEVRGLNEAAKEAEMSGQEFRRNLDESWKILKREREERAIDSGNQLFTETTPVTAFQAKAMLANLVAFEYLGDQVYLNRAEELLKIIRQKFYNIETGLLRMPASKAGAGEISARAQDYMETIRALLTFHQMTLDPKSLEFAQTLSEECYAKLKDENGYLAEVSESDLPLEAAVYSTEMLFGDSTFGSLPILLNQIGELKNNEELRNCAQQHAAYCLVKAQSSVVSQADFLSHMPYPSGKLILLTGRRDSSKTQELAADLRALKLNGFEFLHVGPDKLVNCSLEIPSLDETQLIYFHDGKMVGKVSDIPALKKLVEESFTK